MKISLFKRPKLFAAIVLAVIVFAIGMLFREASISSRPGFDFYGDELPSGSIARLGTLRCRQRHHSGRFFDYSADDKHAVVYFREGLCVYETDTGKALRGTEQLRNGVLAASFGRNEVTLLDGKGGVIGWSPTRPAQVLFSPLNPREHEFREGAAFSFDGRLLVTSTSDAAENIVLRVWDVSTQKHIRERVIPKTLIFLQISPNGNFLALADQQSIRLWDFSIQQEHKILRQPTPVPFSIAFTADSTVLGVASYDSRQIRLVNLASHKEFVFEHGEVGTHAIVFSPDGTKLAHGGDAGIVHLADAKLGKPLQQIAATYPIHCLSFSRQGNAIGALVGLPGNQSEFKSWNIATGKAPLSFSRHDAAIHSIAFSKYDKKVITSSSDGVRVWETATGKHLLQFGSAKANVKRFAFALRPNSSELVIGDGQQVTISDTTSGKTVGSLPGTGTQVIDLAFSPHSDMFATIRFDSEPMHLSDIVFDTHNVQVRNWTSGKVLWSVSRVLDRRVAFSPDGKWLVTAAGKPGEGEITVWDSASGRKLRDFSGYAFAIFPDSQSLVTIHGDCRIRHWEIANGREIGEFGTSDGSARNLAFSPDGRLLAVPGWPVRIFEVSTHQLLWQDKSHRETVQTVAFSNNGKLLATGSEDSTVLIWDVGTLLNTGVNLQKSSLRLNPL